MKRDFSAENNVRDFYDGKGWDSDSSGATTDAQLWEDLRPCASDYVSACRRKLLEFLPRTGDRLLDAASGPVQYPEYLDYSRGFNKRVCVDLSQKALDQAQKKLGDHGEYVCASILELPFEDRSFDAVVSLHTIYHIEARQQEAAVRQLIRVARPGAPIVIVYSNPDRLFARLRRLATGRKGSATENLYFHPQPLAWWDRFRDSCEVELHPWRTLTAQDSRRLIPDNALGHAALRVLLEAERGFPACHLGRSLSARRPETERRLMPGPTPDRMPRQHLSPRFVARSARCEPVGLAQSRTKEPSPQRDGGLRRRDEQARSAATGAADRASQ